MTSKHPNRGKRRDFLRVVESKDSKPPESSNKQVNKRQSGAKRREMTQAEMLAARKKLIDHLHRFGF